MKAHVRAGYLRSLCAVAALIAADPLLAGDAVTLKSAPSRSRDCGLELYDTDSDVKRPFEKLCVLSMIGSDLASATEKIRKQACACGADAIILREVGSGEYAHPFNKERRGSVAALAIRYTDIEDGHSHLETTVPFALTDRSTLNRGWVKRDDYRTLSSRRCDGIMISSEKGLLIDGKARGNGEIESRIRVRLENAAGNRKQATIKLQITKAEKILATGQIGPLRLGKDAKGEARVTLTANDLFSEPPPMLQIILDTTEF